MSFPASQLPNPFGSSSSLHAFCINRNTRVSFYVCPRYKNINARSRTRHCNTRTRSRATTGSPVSYRPLLRFTSYVYETNYTAGVRGKITRFVTTIHSASSTYHFYELEVQALDSEWLESKERQREWVDYGEALRRISWKKELAQGLMLSSMAPR